MCRRSCSRGCCSPPATRSLTSRSTRSRIACRPSVSSCVWRAIDTRAPTTLQCAPMLRAARRAAPALVLVLAAVRVATAETAVERARALIARYDEDPARLDRARQLLEHELTRERRVEMLPALAQACFLSGEVRAQTDDAKLAAYTCGREAGQRAVELAPRSEEA